jgi:hypothetical protein
MGVYNNNKDGTRSTLANTIQVVEGLPEQYVTEAELLQTVDGIETQFDGKLEKKVDKPKCVITIIDDDGTNRTNDQYTGIISFLNNKGIPLTLAVPTEAPSKSSGTYKLAELHTLEEAGNEVIMHGVSTDNSTRTMTQAEFETMVDTMISWASTNGFNDKIFAYPGGAFINNDNYGLNPKIAYLKSNGITLAYGVNQSVEKSEITNYEEWYSYANGHEYGGVANRVPFVTMPNGYSKALLANRMELKRDTLTESWWQTRLRTLIENKTYITFFMHSWVSEWTTAGADGKTTADLFKETIDSLVAEFGDAIEWKTAGEALEIINNMNVTSSDLDAKLDYNALTIDSLQSVVVASSDFADFQTRVAALQ